MKEVGKDANVRLVIQKAIVTVICELLPQLPARINPTKGDDASSSAKLVKETHSIFDSSESAALVASTSCSFDVPSAPVMPLCGA